MSSGQLKVHHGFNATQIKNGKIVRISKDGRIKAVLDDYKVKHVKQLPKKAK